MVLHMRTCDRIALDNILLHKEYFDQRLLDITSTLDAKVTSLTTKNSKLESANQNYKKYNSDLRLQIKDTKTQKSVIHIKYLDLQKEHNDILEYLKDIQRKIDELEKENEKQRKEIEHQEKDIQKQKKIIDKMKYMNSTNSNFPSSFDILGRTKAKAQANTREKTERSRGGQKNHPLHKSKLSSNIDHIIKLKVKKAPTGALPYIGDCGLVEYYVTQEVDVLLKSVITETRYYIDEKATELDNDIISKYAINPLSYSGDFKATTIYLNQKGTIPLQRLCDMLCEISKGSIQLQPGTIVKWSNECHRKSVNKKEEILSNVLKGDLIFVDETGFRINGEQYWIHVMTNETGAFYTISKSRGDKEKGPVKALELYTGTLMHDHFSAYQSLDMCHHAECNAHIDRYLKAGIDFDHNEYCKEMLELLHEMLFRKNELMKENIQSMPEGELKKYEERYTSILEKGLKQYEIQNDKIDKKYEADYVKTFRRMLVYKEDHLRFIKDFNIPYTNNAAERQCRVIKSKKKISGQFVSEAGGEAYVSILSLLQSSKIKKENALEMLEYIFH